MMVGLIALVGCKDDSKAPIITFDQAIKGAYVRLIEEGAKTINLFDITGSKYTYSVEFVDLERGDLVAEYNLDVTFRDNSPQNGNSAAGPLRYKSFPASSFQTTANGYKGISNIEVPATDMLTLFGFAPEDLGAGDVFRVDGSLVLQDGSVYTFSNSTGAVNGSAFQGHFRFDLPAICPSSLQGSYDYVATSTFCGSLTSGTVKIIANGGGSYDFDDWSLGSYPACYGGLAASWGQLEFKDVCNKVSFTGIIDNYGDTWTFTSTVNGTEWTLGYVNTYGESGTAIITNPAGWTFTTD
jgi:hypothetical protein